VIQPSAFSHLLISPRIAFDENVVLSAHPSKSGSDWWYGTLVKNNQKGFFPSSYVTIIDQGPLLVNLTALSHCAFSHPTMNSLGCESVIYLRWWYR
jgi:hypothetical protein